MPRKPLTIDVTRLDAGHARLRLTGELDFDTSPELVTAAGELRADGFEQLTVDLSGVTLCDSSGLSALVVIYRGGTRLGLTGVGGQLQQLLDRTGLAELLLLDRAEPGGLRETG